MDKKILENRLIDLSVNITEWVLGCKNHVAVSHLQNQIIRSSTAAALNYGEAQSAESKKDFIHKIGIVMKELRETQINLRIISRFKTDLNKDIANQLLRECDELLAIFYKTVRTARSTL